MSRHVRQFSVRVPTGAECRAIATIEQRSFPDHPFSIRQLRYYRKRARATILAGFGGDARLAGYVVGSLDLRFRPRVLWVHSMAVVRGERRKSLGRQLLARLLAWGQRRGAARARLHVALDRRPAIHLYRSMSFVVIETVVDYYASGRHALLMQKDLRPPHPKPAAHRREG